MKVSFFVFLFTGTTTGHISGHIRTHNTLSYAVLAKEDGYSQYAVISQPAADEYVGLYRRSSELDVIQPSSAQRPQDGDAMVRIRTATKSTIHLNIPSLHRLCDTIHSRSRPR